MRHADLRRRSNSSDSQGSVDAVEGYCCVIPGMGVWSCGCVFCGGMSDAMGSKNRCNFFSTDISSRKSQVFRLDPPVGKLSRKKLIRKSPFSTV